MPQHNEFSANLPLPCTNLVVRMPLCSVYHRGEGWKGSFGLNFKCCFESEPLVRTAGLIHFPSFVCSVRKQPFPQHCFQVGVFYKMLFHCDTFPWCFHFQPVDSMECLKYLDLEMFLKSKLPWKVSIIYTSTYESGCLSGSGCFCVYSAAFWT